MKDFIKHKLRENIRQTEEYQLWLNNNSKNVKIYDIKNILKPDLSLMTSNFNEYLSQNLKYKEIQKQSNDLLNTKININECFQNAGLVFQFYNNIPNITVEYVLGLMTQNGKTFGHAWNIINDIHYDFTSEKTEKSNSVYNQIVKFNNIENIQNLPMFNPDEKCEESFNVNGESFDINGMCSLYPYYKSICEI